MGHVRHVGAPGLGEEGGACRSQEGQSEPGERPHSLPSASCSLGAGNKTGVVPSNSAPGLRAAPLTSRC